MGNTIATIILIALIVLVVGWLLIRLLSRSYIKTTATTAFVRTGGLRSTPQPLVVTNGAAWVFNFLHRLKWVSLETMAIEVRHIEGHAAITNDPQYVDIEARFFIKVKDEPDSISRAARTVGGDTVDEGSVRRLVEPKLSGAIRDVAVTFSLKDLLEKRMDFTRQVLARLKDDLAENGLVIESISLLTLRPTLQGHFSTDDILGAQVARANAAVIEQALTEKTRLESEAALIRARQEAGTERERMALEEEIEKERAQRARNISTSRATEEAAARVVQEEKRQEAERARILAERALQEEALENERLDKLLREQAARALAIERVQREQEVALAEQERERQIAEATAAKLSAARLQIEADSQREQALQQAMTAAEKAAASRDAEIELMNTRVDTEKQALVQKSEVELEVLRLKEMAEAEAKATLIRAEAELEAAKKRALGERERQSAAGLAEVQVAVERAKAAEHEADAIRLKLLAQAEGEKAKSEALASHQGVGQQLEVLRIQADVQKAIEIARAEALGKAISGMNMNLFGDSNTAQQILSLIATAQGAQHVYDNLPPIAQNTLAGIASRLSGQPISPHGNGEVAPLVDQLLGVIQQHYPEALKTNPTLGEVLDVVLYAEDENEDDIFVSLRRVADNPDLRDLPLQTALTLAKDWLGWRG